MHVSDWLPTLLEAVRPSLSGLSRQKLDNFDLGNIDGVSQWPTYWNPSQNPRTKLLYNIDPGSGEGDGNAAFRMGDMKIILGNPGEPDGWIPPPNVQGCPCKKPRDFNTTTWLFNLTGVTDPPFAALF